MLGDDLVDFADSIESREDFIKFLEYYMKDFQVNKDDWENTELLSYISGLSGFVSSMEGYYKNKGESVDLEQPTWKVFAHILLAACVYE